MNCTGIFPLSEKIMVLDGAMGTMLLRYGLRPGECPEEMVLKNPDIVRRIHREYLQAGADIITTDTFNDTSVSLEKYGLSGRVREIARTAASLAREETDKFGGRFVAGSIGPTSQSASIATDMEDMSLRSISFNELTLTYAEEIRGLSEGGADLLILETFFDSLNAKAAIYAAETVFKETGRRLPMIVSATLMSSGRLLTGQTTEAYFTSIMHSNPIAISMNCSFGASAMLPHVASLSAAFPHCRICAYPNAGLPNASGGYDQTPAEFAAGVEEFMRGGYVNIVGGCCGTTPDHIRAVAQVAGKYSPRTISVTDRKVTLSGLEAFSFDSPQEAVRSAVDIRTNSEFMFLAQSGEWDEALWSIHDMVDEGTPAVDLCLDGMTDDVPAALSHLLLLMGADPVTAAVPLVITSSYPAVIEAGLKVFPGKCAVRYTGTSDEARYAIEHMAESFGAVSV